VEKVIAEWLTFHRNDVTDCPTAELKDGCWVYPDTHFNPQVGESVYCTVEHKVSKAGKDYYVANRWEDKLIIQPPVGLKELVEETERIRTAYKKLACQNAKLVTENNTLKSNGAGGIDIDELKQANLYMLLGSNEGDGQKKRHKELAKILHSDKTRLYGKVTQDYLEHLLKTINGKM